MSVAVKSKESKTRVRTSSFRQYAMLMMLVVIVIMFQWLTKGKLLKPMNVSNPIFQNAYVVILAVGMLMCILSGGNIDLSVGSVVAFIGACAGTFAITWKWNPYLSVVICLGIGILIGMWHGFWIAYVRIPAFIVTLSGMLVFRGLTLVIIGRLTIAPFPPAYKALSTGYVKDLFSWLNPFGLGNGTSLVIGVIIAAAYCLIQALQHRSRKKKGYATEKVPAMALHMLIIVAAVIALFYRLGEYRGIPTVLISLGIILLVYSFITNNTVIGRRIYALGGNEKAARLSGIKTQRLLFLVYVNMAFLAAVAFDVISKQRLLSPAFDKFKRLIGIAGTRRGKGGM